MSGLLNLAQWEPHPLYDIFFTWRTEGKDRATLYMSEYDYKLVERVAAEFKKAGKKTIIVVETNFPVIMEEIQNNSDVDAIIYQPYGGQYDGKALAEILFGDVNPTGRLTATWYKDMSALDEISEYSIPEGMDLTLAQIDPIYHKDMTNADPIEAELTYLYNESPITYEFGYGLSYSTFKYSNFEAPFKNNGGVFTATVDVTNTGDVETSEVVQLYIRNIDSDYGNAVPRKQLVSYEKIKLAPGETRTVTLEVDPEDFKVWDVNRGVLIVEGGLYNLMVGSSSEKIYDNQNIAIAADSIATLNPRNEFNVFDHSFDTEDVVYNEISKKRTAEGLKNNKIVGGYYSVTSKRDGSWTVLPKVYMTNAKTIIAKVATNTNGGTISLCADFPTAEPLATITVPKTEEVSYVVNSMLYGTRANELGYIETEADITEDLTGIHNIYVVFNDAGLRIDSIKIK